MASDNKLDQVLPQIRPTHGSYPSALVGASQVLVNSRAMVPLQSSRSNMFPMQFQTIRLNTDLNHLPQDWDKKKFQGYGFHTSHNNSFSPFTSVNLAHNYKDLVGKVDVISSSKNIKDLLKMPYQQSPRISLMVHRLGNTLLLEEFDVHKHLIKNVEENWKWLNDFFQRYVSKEDKNSSLVSIKPQNDLLSDVMYRNLIRHSITASVTNNACLSVENNDVPQNVFQAEEETQDLKGFHHESLWRFHDRSMLVDSDLPIFGTESKCPCISLRLRDSPPISVLTGLDYWLDNLMSNVPEVAMVYHLNGFVQKYEILRTEDIPQIENSKFNPEEVMELAQNVMAFIKSRTVAEGHTYWLYKSEHDDMVKLYDLTEYCKKELRKDDNPFTVPVGLLCYHVGRNIKMSNQRRSADCRAMLENCLRLLVEEDHPQICADAHFLLADMWVPDKSLHDIWQGDGKIADPPDDLYDEDENSENDSTGSEAETEMEQSQNGQNGQDQNGQNGQDQKGQNGLDQKDQNGLDQKDQNGLDQKDQNGQGQKGQHGQGQKGQHGQTQKGQNGQTQKRQNGQTQKGQNGQTQKGQNGQTQKGQNGQAQKGQNGQTQKGQNGQTQKGQNGQTQKGQNGQSLNGKRQTQKDEESNLVKVKDLSLQDKKKTSPQKSQKKRDDKDEVAVKELVVRGMIKHKAWDVLKVCRIAGETDERCRQALEHIRKGLQCIDKDLEKKSKPVFNEKDKPADPNHNATSQSSFDSQSANVERDQLRFAKPFVPIPLHYAPIYPGSSVDDNTSNTSPPLSEDKTKSLSKSKSSKDGSQESESDNSSKSSKWHSDLKLRLLRKAAIAFYILADQFFASLQKRGHTLRYIRYGLHCYECLFKKVPKPQPDALEEELYFHLIHLAGKTRSNLEISTSSPSYKDFGELSEVEAAILHSAQAILQTPKEAWIYTWPDTEDKNVKAANDLYKKLMRTRSYEKRSLEQRNTISRQIGIIKLNHGTSSIQKIRARIKSGEKFESVQPAVEKAKKILDEAVSHFMYLNDRSAAGNSAFSIISLYHLTTECLRFHTNDKINPVSKQEFVMLQKMTDACERALSIYERDESTDKSREMIYHMLRDKYFNVASRYFHVTTLENYKKAKELLQKSLSYCFLDLKSTNPTVINGTSYRIGAIVHFNLAKFIDRECIAAQFDSPHYRALRRKMYDHLQMSFEVYSFMRWCRSAVSVKTFLLEILTEEFPKNPTREPIKVLRRALRHIFQQIGALQPVIDYMHTDNVNGDDDSRTYNTLLAALNAVLTYMSTSFKRWLQFERNTELYAQVKALYWRTIRLTMKPEMEYVAFPLSQTITDIHILLQSELFNSLI